MRVAVVLGASAVFLAGCGGGNDSARTTTGATTAAQPVATGRQLFLQNCSGCHTLTDAGASGTVGPNLDEAKPTKARVLFKLENGGGGMPKFKGTLSDVQLQALATYVSSVAGKS